MKLKHCAVAADVRRRILGQFRTTVRLLTSAATIFQTRSKSFPSSRLQLNTRMLSRSLILALMLLLVCQSIYLNHVVTQNFLLVHRPDSVLLATNAFNLGYVNGANEGMKLARQVILGDLQEDRILREIVTRAYNESANAAQEGLFDHEFLLLVDRPVVDAGVR